MHIWFLNFSQNLQESFSRISVCWLLLGTSLLNKDFLEKPSGWYFRLLVLTKCQNNLFGNWIFWMLFLKFSIYLSGTTSSLTSGSNLLHLLRKYKIISIKNTNAVMQPTALPTITFMLLHLSLISVLVGVGSKLNKFLVFTFLKTK